MKVQKIGVRPVFDSRGKETIEVVFRAKRIFSAKIPSGASRGTGEASVFTPAAAKKSAEKVQEKLRGKEFCSLREFDLALLALDSSSRKEKIGGNVALGLSIAAARALAFEKNQEPWELLSEEFFPKVKAPLPLLFSNVINGGAHARSNLDLQEYMFVADPSGDLLGAVRQLISLYRELGALLKKERRVTLLPRGDEGGYALDFSNNLEPLELLQRIVEEKGLGRTFSLALDAAASQFFRKGRYSFDGALRTSQELHEFYLHAAENVPLLFSVEDPFAEQDREAFRAFLKKAGKSMWVVGDDLTATHAEEIRNARGLVNGVIIKPNQVGTVTETCEALEEARKQGMKVIVSHRSGETSDQFIVHLARACGADGVKLGAPAGERMGKYNELLRVYTV
ncbi:hypothetical protein KKI17_00790 [Patescibacteria group bacterium]|nr:hypothetical protein [Patescibacteria group bacterium]